MSKIKIEITKCDYCGDIIEGRSDNGDIINYCGIKSKDINQNEVNFCISCWNYAIQRSKNKKELFQLIEKETTLIICDYEYVCWHRDKESEDWKRS